MGWSASNEMLLKLRLRVSPRTVGKHMVKRPSSKPPGDQRWATFLSNHAKAILAFNEYIENDSRVQQVMLTIRDGLLLIQKK